MLRSVLPWAQAVEFSGVCGEESDAWKVNSTYQKRHETKDKDPCDTSHMGLLIALLGNLGLLLIV